MRTAILSGLLLGMTLTFGAGCTEEVNVTVNCETVAEPEVAVVCQIKQTKGKSEVEACWDFAVTCANGAVVESPRACVKVKDGGNAEQRTPGANLKNLDKCAGDKPPTAAVSNLTIDGKAAKTTALPSPVAPAAPVEAPPAPAK